MKQIARLFLGLTGLLLLAYYLPAGYGLLTEKTTRPPSIQYSATDKKFLFYRYDGESMKLTDEQGKVYDREDFERMLPFMNWAQLSKDGRMPKRIDGVDVTIEKIRRAQFSLRLAEGAMDVPVVPLYPLLESDSGRAKLEMPEDFMRLSDRVEFLDPKTNKTDTAKTQLFAKAFADAGFVFPAKLVAGNPTNRKPFDEGYFVQDAKGQCFRLRMAKGQPSLLKFAGELAKGPDAEAWQALRPRFFVVQESDPRELRALVVDEAGQVFLVLGADYKLLPLPLKHYVANKADLNVRGDLLNRMVLVRSADHVEALVFDTSYKLIARYEESFGTNESTPAGRLARHLFPFTLRLEDDSSAFFRFWFGAGSLLALGINGALLVGFFLWGRRRKLLWSSRWPDLVLIAGGGVFGLVVVIAMPSMD